jgi:membrane protein implicated in regulation of membrane protease activity
VVDKFNNRVQAFRVTVPGEASLLRGLSVWWCVVPLLLILLMVLIAYVIRRWMRRRHAEDESVGSENADGDAIGLASADTFPED